MTRTTSTRTRPPVAGPACAAALPLAFLLAVPAFAQDRSQAGTPQTSNDPLPGPKQEDTSKPTWAGDIDTRQNLQGDIGGIRTALDAGGSSFGLTETAVLLRQRDDVGHEQVVIVFAPRRFALRRPFGGLRMRGAVRAPRRRGARTRPAAVAQARHKRADARAQ